MFNNKANEGRTPLQVFDKACEELGITRTTPAVHLNAEQLFILISLASGGQVKQESKEYLYGLRGIQDEFRISHKTAQEWKNTWLSPAISQSGKVILCDKAMAHELFKQRKEGRL